MAPRRCVLHDRQAAARRENLRTAAKSSIATRVYNSRQCMCCSAGDADGRANLQKRVCIRATLQWNSQQVVVERQRRVKVSNLEEDLLKPKKLCSFARRCTVSAPEGTMVVDWQC